MSIGLIVTEGYGPGATVQAVALSGYSVGAGAPWSRGMTKPIKRSIKRPVKRPAAHGN